MIGRSRVSQIKTLIRGLAQPIHKHFRGGKSERFLGLLNTQPGKLLDVGGGTGMNGEFARLYQKFDSVTVVNLDPPEHDAEGAYNLRIVNADGVPCRLWTSHSIGSFPTLSSSTSEIGKIRNDSRLRSGESLQEATSLQLQISIFR